MDPAAAQLDALLELEARHDALLKDLDDLDKRVATVLAECLPAREAAVPVAAATSPSMEGVAAEVDG